MFKQAFINRIRAVPFLLLDVITPNKPLVAFSAGLGRSYNGNPKYLLEFILKNHIVPLENMIWIFSNRVSFESHSVPIKKVMSNSIEGLRQIASSRVWITDHSYSEFGPNLLRTHKIVQLWHGVGPKREPSNSVSTLKKRHIRKSWQRFDAIISTSAAAVPHYFDFFELQEGKVYFFGYARHEFLSKKRNNSFYAETMRRKLSSDQSVLNKKWILFAPTWRDNGLNISNEELKLINDVVNENGGILFVRAHPIFGDQLPLLNKGYFDASKVGDIIEYLPAFDGLITDYSSIAYDFAILRKPMVFYLFDYEEMNRERGLNFVCPDDYPGHVAFNLEELEHGLFEVLKGNSKNIEPVLKKFYPDDIESACRKTADLIIDLMKE